MIVIGFEALPTWTFCATGSLLLLTGAGAVLWRHRGTASSDTSATTATGSRSDAAVSKPMRQDKGGS